MGRGQGCDKKIPLQGTRAGPPGPRFRAPVAETLEASGRSVPALGSGAQGLRQGDHDLGPWPLWGTKAPFPYPGMFCRGPL